MLGPCVSVCYCAPQASPAIGLRERYIGPRIASGEILLFAAGRAVIFFAIAINIATGFAIDLGFRLGHLLQA